MVISCNPAQWSQITRCNLCTSLFPNLSDPFSNTRHNLNTPKRQIYTSSGIRGQRYTFTYVVFTIGGQRVPLFSFCVTYFLWRLANLTNNSHEHKKCAKIFFQLGDNLSPCRIIRMTSTTSCSVFFRVKWEKPVGRWAEPQSSLVAARRQQR